MINFNKILPNFQSLREIGTDKRLAKFGDIITNMAYLLAITASKGEIDAKKVSKKILSNALKKAKMKKYAKKRPNSHDMANTVEAFLGYMYLYEHWGIEKMAKILIKILNHYNFEIYKEEIDGSIQAFSQLLQIILKKIGSEFKSANQKDEK